MKHAVIGILAHVDAGKTTLSEELLYRTGTIRKKGSVDTGDTVMDSDAMEADRGITIYSSEALLRTEKIELQLIDTPGHVDFSGEAERALSVLDAAILVLSGSEGVQSHTRTLWDLLRKHHIPTVIFVNKMDIAHSTREELLLEMQQELSSGILNLMPLLEQGEERQNTLEEIATIREDLLEQFLEQEDLSTSEVQSVISQELLFPAIFGCARDGEGVGELLSILEEYLPEKQYPEEFGALCYKVDRDGKGKRYTYLKVTGGTLQSRMEIGEEKVTEVRLLTGEKQEAVSAVPAGMICAVTGLDTSRAGQGYGIQEDMDAKDLEPIFRYRVLPEGNVSTHTLMLALRELEEEDPLLDVTWEQTTDEIHISLMGEIQKEILTATLQNRFDIPARFAESRVTYKETITAVAEGHGHFEPLRHFADVWLRLEPLPAGSGISAVSECSTDELDANYQRQILRRILTARTRGVITNSEITDIRFVLTHGKSHTKHTEGGDFRRATDLAIRDALLHARGILLEPHYHVRLLVPMDKMGRAMTDLTKMHGELESPQTIGDKCLLEGVVPVSEISDYQAAVNSYTGGLGSLSLEPGGYLPCHNEDQVVELMDYDYRRDPERPYVSIYVHQEMAPYDTTLDGRSGAPYAYGYDVSGAGVVESGDMPIRDAEGRMVRGFGGREEENGYQGYGGLENDLQEIFERTYGKIERRDLGQSLTITAEPEPQETVEEAKASYLASHPKEQAKRQEKKDRVTKRKKYVIVDGYNVIFSWPELQELSKVNIDSARGKLLDVLSNYQGYLGCELIAVFDAYRVQGGMGSAGSYHNIQVVYTKQDETADAYIERKANEILKAESADVTVVTSDGLVQMIVLGEGAHRISSREFKAEVDRVNREGQENYL